MCAALWTIVRAISDLIWFKVTFTCDKGNNKSTRFSKPALTRMIYSKVDATEGISECPPVRVMHAVDIEGKKKKKTSL